jgi:hypothetical protein
MKIKNILLIGVTAGIGLLVTRGLTGFTIFPKSSLIYDWLHPEEARLKNEVEEQRALKEVYWKAYLDARTVGIDRVEALTTALDPLDPDRLFNYPFLDMSFAQMVPTPYPGLPTLKEWGEIVNARLNEAIKEQAIQYGHQWSDPLTWPTPL